MELYILLPIIIVFLILFVGNYVFMFLHIMRSDPREVKFRKDEGIGNELIPRKINKKRSKNLN